MTEKNIKKFFNKIKRFNRLFLAGIKKGNISQRAASLGYNMLMAAIPLLMVFFQLASNFLANPESVFYKYLDLMPVRVATIIENIINYLYMESSSTSLGLGLVTAIWLGSNGIKALMVSVNESMEMDFVGNFIVTRLIAIVYTILFMFSLIFMLLFTVYSGNLGAILYKLEEVLPLKNLVDPILAVFESILPKMLPVLFFLVVLVLFYKTSSVVAKGNIRFKEALIGGLFAGISIFLITVAYAFVMDNISKLSIYFGSLAGILGLFIWTRFVCIALLGGAHAMAAYRDLASGKDSEITPWAGPHIF